MMMMNMNVNFVKPPMIAMNCDWFGAMMRSVVHQVMVYLSVTCGIDKLAVESCHQLFDGIAFVTYADCAVAGAEVDLLLNQTWS